MAGNPRQAAYRVLMRCRRSGAWSEDAISSEIQKTSLSGRDGALCSRIVLGVLQNRTWLDFIIGTYCATPTEKLDPRVLDILRLSAYQILFLDKIPVSAAVNEGVSLCRREVNPGAAKLVNAVLRRIGEHREQLPEVPGMGTEAYLATRYSHPLWLAEELAAEHGYAFAEAALAANNEQPPVYAHANPLRPGTDLLTALADFGAEPTDLPGCVSLRTTAGITETEVFRNGGCYIQDAAARMAALAGGAKPGMTVLDACAAPGGKSVASAMAMENRGRVISCDIHEKKLRLIRENAARLGINIIETRAGDARRPDADLTGIADLVIADVPCSGLGVIRRKPEIRWKDQAELDNLPAIQRDILEGLAPCVRAGGVLLYSTCTVRTRENGGTVSAFLADHPEFTPEGFILPGSIGEVPSGQITLWPHLHGTDGFYICKMRKKS